MARLDRRVTAPDGIEWIVGRRFLFGPPRYIGFRFGVPTRVFEPRRVRRVALTDHPVRSPTATVTQRRRRSGLSADRPIDWENSGRRRTQASGSAALDDGNETGGGWFSGSSSGSSARSGRRSYRHSGGTIFVPTWSGSTSRGSSSSTRTRTSGSTLSRGLSSATGTRGLSSATRSRGGGGDGDDGGSGGSGGGAAAGVAGAGAALVKVLKIALIVIAVVAALLLTIFVLIPALIFLFWALAVGLSMLWHALTRRPWIVEARENRPAPTVRAWAVAGWRQSAVVIDEVADAIAEGKPVELLDATEVTVT